MEPLETCSLCTISTPTQMHSVVPNTPAGWSRIVIAERGHSVRNFLLCFGCTSAVRREMSRLGDAYRDSLSDGSVPSC
jgi:hypothetical protein